MCKPYDVSFLFPEDSVSPRPTCIRAPHISFHPLPHCRTIYPTTIQSHPQNPQPRTTTHHIPTLSKPSHQPIQAHHHNPPKNGPLHPHKILRPQLLLPPPRNNQPLPPRHLLQHLRPPLRNLDHHRLRPPTRRHAPHHPRPLRGLLQPS